MTVASVKKRIKIKFRSYSEFAEVAGIDRYVFQRDFLTASRVEKKEIQRISGLCDKLEPIPEIDPKDLAKLKKGIAEAGGVIAFCRDNKQFSEDSVFQILASKRKRMTDKLRELFEFFDIAV